MVKKYIILLTLFIVSSSLIYEASCYTSASVQSSASFSIVDSKQALIGIPSSLTLKDNKIVTDIKNNTNEKIWVKVDKGSIVSSGIKANSDLGVSIEAGGIISVTINFDKGDKVSELNFHARWHGNSYAAEIRSTINK